MIFRGTMKSMSEAVRERDFEAYIKITDDVFTSILNSTDEALHEPRAILRMIMERNFFVLIGEAVVRGIKGPSVILKMPMATQTYQKFQT